MSMYGFSPYTYKVFINELKEAYYNADLSWFTNNVNRYWLHELQLYWNFLYRVTKLDKYKYGCRAISKLKHISTNKERWNNSMQEILNRNNLTNIK